MGLPMCGEETRGYTRFPGSKKPIRGYGQGLVDLTFAARTRIRRDIPFARSNQQNKHIGPEQAAQGSTTHLSLLGAALVVKVAVSEPQGSHACIVR